MIKNKSTNVDKMLNSYSHSELHSKRTATKSFNSPLAVPWFKAFPNERIVCIILLNLAEFLI